jgi:SPP1 gp7 family putative phage head morphogenesis protein
MNKVDLAYAFGLKPEKAIAYFKAKGFAFSWDWQEVWQEAHSRAFTVAKAMKLDILQDLRDAVQDALDNGTTFQEFNKDLEPKLKTKGWWGKQEIVDRSTGEVTSVQLGSPYRLRTIFDQNIQTAYNVGRYRSMIENVENRPYWQYVAVMDARTRPAHAALNDKVLKSDDPFWNSFYPPNGWRCRCRVSALDGGDLGERDLKVESSAGKLSERDEIVSQKTGEMAPVTVYKGLDEFGKKVTVAPDVGFSYNPGKFDWQPDPKRYDPELRKLL